MVFAPVLPTMGVVALALAGFLALAIRLFTEKSFKLRYSPLNKYILIYLLNKVTYLFLDLLLIQFL